MAERFSIFSQIVENLTATSKQNDKINPAIRLQACQTIINTAVKFVELSDRAEDRALRAKEYERGHRTDKWDDAIDSLFNIG